MGANRAHLVKYISETKEEAERKELDKTLPITALSALPLQSVSHEAA